MNWQEAIAAALEAARRTGIRQFVFAYREGNDGRIRYSYRQSNKFNTYYRGYNSFAAIDLRGDWK